MNAIYVRARAKRREKRVNAVRAAKRLKTRARAVRALSAAIVILPIFSCASLRTSQSASVLADALDPDAALYLSLPAAVNKTILADFAEERFPDLNARPLLNRIDRALISFSPDSKQIRVIAAGAFPRSLVSRRLSRDGEWTKRGEWFSHKTGISAAAPASGILLACIGDGMEEFLEDYRSPRGAGCSEFFYEKANEDALTLYARSGGLFSNLFNGLAALPIAEIDIAAYPAKDGGQTYFTDIYFRAIDEQTARAAAIFLKIAAVSLTSSNDSPRPLTQGSTAYITELQIKADALQAMLNAFYIPLSR